MNFGLRGIAGNKLDLTRRVAAHGALPYLSPFANLVQGNAGSIAPATPNTQVRVTAGVLCLEDGLGNYKVLRNFDATASSAAKGIGGLDTGTVANSTCYFTFAVWDPTTGQSGVVLSLSATAPALKGGLYSLRTGAIFTDSSGNFVAVHQRDQVAQYTSPLTMISGASGSISTPTWTAVAVSAFVPTTARALRCSLFGASGSGGLGAYAAPNNSYAVASAPLGLLPNNASLVTRGVSAMLLESGNVYYCSSTAGFGLYCYGWEDNL